LKDKYRYIRQGQGEEFPSVGSMTFEKQVEIVESPYLDAKNRGAKILVGGIRKTDQVGLFHEPSILIDLNHDMIIMQEETFGPEISVMPFSDENTAIGLANDSANGLNASVWTSDPDKAIWWYPYSRKIYNLFSRVIRIVFG